MAWITHGPVRTKECEHLEKLIYSFSTNVMLASSASFVYRKFKEDLQHVNTAPTESLLSEIEYISVCTDLTGPFEVYVYILFMTLTFKNYNEVSPYLPWLASIPLKFMPGLCEKFIQKEGQEQAVPEEVEKLK